MTYHRRDNPPAAAASLGTRAGGREDEVIDPAPDGERAVAAIPGATLELTEGGHMLLVSHPEASAAFIPVLAERLPS